MSISNKIRIPKLYLSAVLLVGVMAAPNLVSAQSADEILARCFLGSVPEIPKLESRRANRVLKTTRSKVSELTSDQPIAPKVLAEYRAHAEKMCRERASANVEAQARMNRILKRLRAHAPPSAQKRKITFELAHEEDLNAFMGVDGQGCLHDGLFEKLPDDGAIAMIMAHEMGHAIHGHVERRLRLQLAIKDKGTAKVRNTYETAKSKTGDYLRKKGYGKFVDRVKAKAEKMKQKTSKLLERHPRIGRTADGVLTFSSQVAAAITMMVFDQEEEYEADRMGLCLMKLAGYSTRHATGFFELVNDKDATTTRESAWRAFLHSHPVPKERIQYLEQLIGRLN